MTNVLIVYGTKEGHTGKIARVLADELKNSGHLVKVVSSSEVGSDVRVEDFDGVVLGASIHISKYPTSFRRWVKDNVQSLVLRPTGFYSVCLGVLEKTKPKAQSDIKNITENFFKSIGWTPNLSIAFAGALPYSKYGWFTRLIMKRIAQKAGGDTDVTRDYEYTNWIEVRQFAREYSELMKSRYAGKHPQLEAWSAQSFEQRP